MKNLKKVIALVAVFAMLVSTVAFAQTFSDVADTDVFAEAVETLSALGIINGDDADNDGVMDFRPDDAITRAETAKIICLIQNLNAAASAPTTFDDVPSSHWASGYIAQAAGQGIINGYGDGNFGPDDYVTYEQVIKMLMEALGYRLFADANGGYPSGYLAAAQRYEVLDGVVGGGVGAEANRGMVAQLVYNAIDTPLMEQTVYGSDNNWSILDGGNISGTDENRKYVSLLKRDLKVYKATGIVTANSLAGGPNTDKDPTIYLTFDNNEVNSNYEFSGVGKTFLQGDVDADDLLGYSVTLFARKNLDGTYTLVNAAKSANNVEVSFTLDLFDGWNASENEISYLRDANSSNETKAEVAGSPGIIFNGVASNDWDMDTFFDPSGLATIKANPNDLYSGQVTLINNDTDVYYDVVKIEIASTAIVNKVNANGVVTILNTGFTVPRVTSSTRQVAIVDDQGDPVLDDSGNPTYKTVTDYTLSNKQLGQFKFENDATDYIVNLTKDGEAVDYTELAKWDVLSVINANNYEVYDIAVLGEANTLDAYVTATRTSNGAEYKLSDGNWYKVATTGDKSVKGLETGDAGRFYIDSYGKIVARDEDVVVDGAFNKISDNYAVVLQAAPDTDTWGKPTVSFQVLDKTGNIAELNLATDVDVYNLGEITGHGLSLGTGEDVKYRLDTTTLTYTPAVGATPASGTAVSFADALVGEMISYNLNSTGAIKAITLAQNKVKDDDLYLANTSARATVNGKYDPDKMKIGSIQIDDDTLVFYVTDNAGNGTVGFTSGSYSNGYSASGAVADYCRVATGADLAEGDYDFVAFDNGDEVAKAIIVYNTTGKIAPSANVAVIESVGDTVINGTDDAYIVEYWMNGELQTATTVADLEEIQPVRKNNSGVETNATVSAERGDVFQFNVSNGVITSAKKIMDYSRAVGGAARNDVALITPTASNNETGTVFGAVSEIASKSGSLTLIANQFNTADGSADGDISGKDAENANVYIMDPNKRDSAQLYVGSIGEVFVPEYILDATAPVSVTFKKGPAITVDPNEKDADEVDAIQRVLDYAFAYQYDGDAIDIVIYKAFEYDAF